MAVDTPVAVGSISVRGNEYPIYGTFDRATEYFAPHISGDTYLDAEFSDKQKALITARRLIDQQNYLGSPAVSTQTTAFPRGSDTAVPIAIETAQYEIALLLLGDPEFFNADTTGSNEKRLKAGPVEIEFFSRTSDGSAPIFPPQIDRLLKPYLGSSISVITPYVGGLLNASNTLGVNGYDINEGL